VPLVRYDAEEADSSSRRAPFDRQLLSPAPPNRSAPPTSDHVPIYPIQPSETSATRLPASHFNVERPLNHHYPQMPADSARARNSYSWSPPSSPGDATPHPHGPRSSQPWSPVGTTFHESNEHGSYYPQSQEHPSASPNLHRRELYHPHQYPRTGAPGWSLRAPNSPVATQRRNSSAQPLNSLPQNQNQHQTTYGSPYMDEHRRDEYDGASSRGP
jgi:hypothetical protein